MSATMSTEISAQTSAESGAKGCAVVIGAGVVGLAAARALALAGHEVIVLEAQASIGTQTSSRNSEVIHAGITYASGSLKARLCVQGKHLLYAYCAERGIAHQRLGKLIVATTDEQLPTLQTICQKGIENGVDDLQLLDERTAQTLEPALQCKGALYSPSTGIVDSHALMLSLHGDIENAGGMVVFHSPVEHIDASGSALLVRTQDGTQIQANAIVNAAGHGAIPLAHRTTGLGAEHIPQAFFVKGQYFTLSGKAPFKRLIYPVPQVGGWGVHLTLDLGGQAKFGPDVQWTDRADDLQVNPQDAERFYREIRRYWPTLPEGSLQPGYCGMRPNIGGPGQAKPDFIIQGPQTHGIKGLINLFGIESPGLTSCLAIGAHAAQLLDAG